MGPTGRPYHGFPTPPKLDGHGPARIISLCNQKGGVGKTTTTINLAAALAGYGRKVLAVDFDPQGALSAGLGIQTHEIPTIYDLLLDSKSDPNRVIVNSGVENLDVIPANIDLSAAEVHLVNEVAREQTLARALRKVAHDYDVVLIDCQPSLGLLTVNALTASHGVIIPLECEFFALRGVALLVETIDKVRDRLNPTITLDGVLATMYDPRTLHSREVLERVVDAFGDDVLAHHRVRARARCRAGLPATGARAGRSWRRRLKRRAKGTRRRLQRRPKVTRRRLAPNPTMRNRMPLPQRSPSLISQHELDITEVSLSLVTMEFISYLRELGPDEELDEASEFLVVAATLLDMKVAGLLPQGELVDAESVALLEARDLLFARLLQYRAFKEVSVWFERCLQRESRRHTRSVRLDEKYRTAVPELAWSLSVDDFAALALLAMTPKEIPRVGLDHLHAPLVSIREQAAIVVTLLRDAGALTFRELIAGVDQSGVVVARFLSVLELYRHAALSFEQLEPLGELTLRWSAQRWSDENLATLGADYDR
ncbi:MAG: chromosome partitioning protein [Microbacterium sp.]|nr:chromosome partitioning protein [Microbacterium sp.]